MPLLLEARPKEVWRKIALRNEVYNTSFGACGLFVEFAEGDMEIVWIRLWHYLKNNLVMNIDDLAMDFGCRVGNLPSTYLGLPLGALFKSMIV